MSINLQYGKHTVTEGCARGEASVRTHVTDVLIMRRLVEREVLEFIISCGTQNWILLGELLQDFLEFFVMHKTKIPLINVVKDVRREGIKLSTKF